MRIPQSEYRVNITGEIMGPMGKRIPINLDNETPRIFADLWDGLKYYPLVDVLAVTFKNVQLPIDLLDQVAGFFIDGDHENRHPSNIGYRFRTVPLPCKERPNYYYVPMLTAYAIEKDGTMVKRADGKFITGYITRASKKDTKNTTEGYYRYSVKLDTGNPFTIGRHRAMLLAFKPYPDCVDRLDSNHENGVPGDDFLDNLEWASRSRNLSHAYETGLRRQNMCVVVRNVLTGEETTYWSISEGARALGLAVDESLRYRLGRPWGTVFADGTQVKFEDDPREWVTPDDPEEAVKRAQQAKPIVVRNCDTGEEFVCGSSKEVERKTGIPWGTVLKRLRDDLRGPHRRHQLRYEDDARPWEVYDPDALEDQGSIARPIEARNILTRETLAFPSVKACVTQHRPRNLVLRLRDGRHPLYPNGWQYKYADEEGWKEESMKDVILENRTGIEARHIGTGELHQTTDIRSLAKRIHITPNGIAAALKTRGKKHYVGWQVRPTETGEPWPQVNELDVAIYRDVPENINTRYYRLTDVKTQEVRYYGTINDVLDVLKTVRSKPVFHRLKRRGELLDGRYQVKVVGPIDHITLAV